MPCKYDASIIGGDSRQVCLASILIEPGFKITTFGLSPDILNNGDSLQKVMEYGKTLITPIPFSKDKVNINNIYDNISIKDFILNLDLQHYLIGGNIPKEVAQACIDKNISYFDIMEDKNISTLNAIATAEGAIAEAIFKSNINLHQSKTLILGYGKCGKVLSSKLRALGAKVTVGARKEYDLTQAYTNCFDCLKLGKNEPTIHEFNFIFNTIPSLILNEKALMTASKDVTIIDIASAPGGVDYECAKKLNLNTHLCLGIPGKFAPKSSAEFIAKAIIPILKERSELN